MADTNTRRIYLITYPRTASNLLQKILALNEQPTFGARQSGGYFMLPVTMLAHELGIRSKNVEDWTEDQKMQIRESYQQCINDMDDFVRTTNDSGKNVFIKEHASFLMDPTAQSRLLFGENSVKQAPWLFSRPGVDANGATHSTLNETVLPDEFLRTFLPTFLIRHPALAFPSHYRAFREIEGKEKVEEDRASFHLTMTLQWTRNLYDFFSNYLAKEEATAGNTDEGATWPIVLDGDDIMNEPAIVTRYAEICGMDTSKLRYSWESTPAEAMHQMGGDLVRRMLSTISASTGVVKGLTSENIDVDTEVEKWKTEFSLGEAELLEKLVRDAMPDYEFLKARRLRPNPN